VSAPDTHHRRVTLVTHCAPFSICCVATMPADDCAPRVKKENKLKSHLPLRAATSDVEATDRRRHDRRRRTFRALVHGSFSPRRKGARRDGEVTLSSVDWHHPQWLAVAIITLLLSTADAMLTLELIQRGAYEANPFMAPLVHGDGLLFAAVKIGLTGGGIVVLILLARARIFGRLPVSSLLYGLLVAYGVLVGYEFWLLQALPEAVPIPI
jgi:uncharacterized protein DUF5658